MVFIIVERFHVFCIPILLLDIIVACFSISSHLMRPSGNLAVYMHPRQNRIVLAQGIISIGSSDEDCVDVQEPSLSMLKLFVQFIQRAGIHFGFFSTCLITHDQQLQWFVLFMDQLMGEILSP